VEIGIPAEIGPEYIGSAARKNQPVEPFTPAPKRMGVREYNFGNFPRPDFDHFRQIDILAKDFH
jgi:hypothetical protein